MPGLRGNESELCAEFAEVIDDQAAGRRVEAVRVRIGARHAVDAEAFRRAFSEAARGTAAQDAAVHLVLSPVTVECEACGRRTETLDPPLRTPAHAQTAARGAAGAPPPRTWTGDAGDDRDEEAYACPRCASDRVTVTGGDELALEAVWFRTEPIVPPQTR
ncbi:hydrogenase maturation nickel metallochaperone HypA [Nonomuraea fastidiosa]|jgi:hydrogenase nickel incorporation protein HypA/HybF|uniref:hydrogenase maturation nickel metallochaperone HypA n=1 Tax=Nonomuraea TaxID=83681 RepID=UPI0032499D5D